MIMSWQQLSNIKIVISFKKNDFSSVVLNRFCLQCIVVLFVVCFTLILTAVSPVMSYWSWVTSSITVSPSNGVNEGTLLQLTEKHTSKQSFRRCTGVALSTVLVLPQCHAVGMRLLVTGHLTSTVLVLYGETNCDLVYLCIVCFVW